MADLMQCLRCGLRYARTPADGRCHACGATVRPIEADLMQQARELLPCPFCGGEAALAFVGNVHSKRKCIVKCGGCRYQRIDAALRHGDDWLRNTAISAWNRRTALRVAPEGYVLVPAEPTEEMLRAGWRDEGDYGVSVGSIYKAMLAARPQGVNDAQ